MNYIILHMPKKTIKRKPKTVITKPKTKVKKHSQKGYQKLLVYHPPKQLQLCYPPRFRTRCFTTLRGLIAAGTASLSCSAYMNGTVTPFYSGSFTNQWPSPDHTLTALMPTGITELLNNAGQLYGNGRVYQSSFEIELFPQLQGSGATGATKSDIFEVTVNPTVTINAPASCAVGMSQPYGKYGTFTPFNAMQNKPVRNRITAHEFIGVSWQSIRDDLSGQFTYKYNTAPATPIFWTVNIQCIDGANSSNNCAYVCRLVHDVELWANSTSSIPQT